MCGELVDQPSPNVSERMYQKLLREMAPKDGPAPTWSYYKLWPNVAIELYPDQIDFMQFMPVSPTETTLRYINYGLSDDRREMRAARYLNWRINRLVNLEDKALIERVQAGMASSSYTVGPLGEGRGVPAQLRPPHARDLPRVPRGHAAGARLEHQPQGPGSPVTAAARKPRYERQVASDRREALVDAAIESLKRFGHEGLRCVGSRPKRVSRSASSTTTSRTRTHWSRRATGRSAAGWPRRLQPRQMLPGEDPHARLRAYFNAFFSRPNLDPQVLTAWIVYWSLVQVSPEMRAVHVEEGRGYGELLGRLLSDLARARRVQADLKQAVVGLTCLLDGLWLKWCLDPESYRPKDAAALCEDWVDRMIDPQPKGFSTR
jgi:hypothetical protein